MTDLTGQYLGRYYLSEQLGEGGMAVVYKAYDTRLEREVAIKIIRSGAFPADTTAELLKRFEREAKSLAKLSHPNIVKVHDYGEHDGSPYLVMEYLPGGTLKKRLLKPLPWQEAVQLLLPIVRSVAYAHQRGILHRDIKPANILITESGEPMLSDFGIAKLFEGEQTTALTGAGMAIGTPEYMAPEQWNGITSPQSDLYSLGIVLYEMVTGRKPYMADTPAAILIKQATEPLPNPRKFAVDLPEALGQVLIKALAKEPADRYTDLNAFVDALDDLHISKPATALLPDEKSVEPTNKASAQPPTASIPTKTLKRDVDETLQVVEGRDQAQEEMKELSRQASILKTGTPKEISRIRIMAILIVGIVCVLTSLLGLPSIEKLLSPAPAATDLATMTLVSETVTQSKPIQLSPTPAKIVTPSSTPTILFTATSYSGSLPTEITDAKGVIMRLVPAGDFTMGSNDGQFDEKPVHRVYLDNFYLDKYEVTNALYKNCVSAGVCKPPQNISSISRPDYYDNSQYDNYPVIYIDWHQAKIYCEWRGGELPTEAQWEKAARGTDERIYPWGSELDCGRANYCEGDTTQVGNFGSGKSPYGLYDMAGNVWEWTMDWYSATYYQDSPSSNPLGPDTGQYHVLRGGAWNHGGNNLYVFHRYRLNSVVNDSTIGFRCAGNVSP